MDYLIKRVGEACSGELYHHGVKGMKWGVRKQQRIRAEMRGDKASLRKFTDKERKRYAEGRVKTMGGKRQAVLSDTAHMLGSTVKTVAKGAAGTVAGGVTGFGSTVVIGTMLGANPLAAGAIAAGMTAFGAATPAAIATGALAIKGGRYVKNMLAIKNEGKR